MVPNRPFCFVHFCGVEGAIKACETLHCQPIPHPDVAPIATLRYFLAYVDQRKLAIHLHGFT